MKTPALAALVVAALIFLPGRSEAQQVNLQIKDGLVTLEAQNVSVRQILAEWARVGGSKIVNGDKVIGSPVTLQLNGVPERQALDTILRGVSGYMLASRSAAGTGASAFDRILILPTSTAAPRTAQAPPVTGYPGPRAIPQPEPAESEIVDDEDNDTDEPEPDNEGGEEVVEPQPPPPGMNPRFQRRFPNPMGVQGQPFVPQQNFPTVAPNQGFEGQVPGVAPSPQNPFGVPAGASTIPGVVTPVPQQQDQDQQQQQQPPRPRPPDEQR